MNSIITKNNYNEMVDLITVGYIKSQNYNSDCVSSSEVSRARAADYVLDALIIETEKAGYCIWSLIEPILQKYGKYLNKSCNPVNPKAKKELDDEINIDMSRFSQFIHYSENVYNEAKKKILAGEMKYN